jgi:hypothetical protein
MHFHKRKKLRQSFYNEIRLKIGRLIPAKPWEKVSLQLERHSTMEPDFDGLCGSFKIITDCLTLPQGRKKYGLGLFVDDKISITGQWDCKWVKSKKKDQKIIIRVLNESDS